MHFDESLNFYKRVRTATEKICDNLEAEDFVVQAHPQVSPIKWHLGHTTWFFENFLLKKFASRRVSPEYYDIAFNSYYKSQGEHWLQAERGHISRPLVKEVYQYRKQIDDIIYDFNFDQLNDSDKKEFQRIMLIGIHHEQQHQELMQMDIHYNNSVLLEPQNLLNDWQTDFESPDEISFQRIDGGMKTFGLSFKGSEFAYDNETPEHQVYVNDFQIANRLVTNREYLEFVNDGAYSKPELWLSDAWNLVEQNQLNKPLYWKNQAGAFLEFYNNQWQDLIPAKPVQNISYYEAYAFAKWRESRLPTEYEWELASRSCQIEPELFYKDLEHKAGKITNKNKNELTSFHGGLWEWTESSYSPFPRYNQDSGALGEYNGKFMCNQKVLKGASFATSQLHYRPSYRNFFYPQQNWAFTGIRLAKDL